MNRSRVMVRLGPRDFAVVWLTMISAPGLLAGDFTVSGGLQRWSGKYIYEASTTTYALTAGIRFHTDQAYTKVLENYEAPQQVSLGAVYQSSPSMSLSVMGSFGLSNTTPDIGISMGVDVTPQHCG